MIDIFSLFDVYNHIFVYKDCEGERDGVDVNCFQIFSFNSDTRKV